MEMTTVNRLFRHTIFLLVLAGFLALCVSGARAGGTGPKLPNPGFRSIGLWDETVPIRMDVAVWYPTSRLPQKLLLEGWSLQVARNGAGVPGKYPVILLSHTTAASRLASHDLAAVLASNGFMVVAPTHPKDNADDTSGVYQANLFVDRPKHLILALEAVERSPILGPLMDRSRIGVLGVGSGAATAFQIAGAQPDLSRLSAACQDNVNTNPLCSRWAEAFHPTMLAEFAAIFANEPKKFTPVIHRKPNDLEQNLISPMLFSDPVPDPGEVYGQRQFSETQPILAVGLLTPGLVDLFPDESLQALTAPVGILAASNDSAYPPEKSIGRLDTLLKRRPVYKILQQADHVNLQPPCLQAFLESFPARCGERSQKSDEFRQLRNEFFIRFFQDHLGLPSPPPPLP